MYNKQAAQEEILSELIAEEGKLVQAEDELTRAISRFNVASHRYAAVRTAMEESLGGKSPYSPDAILPDRGEHQQSLQFGQYRYIQKPVGDAIQEVLAEATKPLTVTDLTVALQNGGRRVNDGRTINAALLNMKGIIKLPTGEYIREAVRPAAEA